MRDLPAPLADPLHILEPWPWRQALVWSLLVLALWLLARWWWRRRGTRRSDVEDWRSIVLPPGSSFEGELDAIRRRANASGVYRRACHELSKLLRITLERFSGRSLDAYTSREIRRQLGDDEHTELLVMVSDLRFGRRAPTRGEFERACDSALQNQTTKSGRP